jgi:adenylosuccinate synthase
MRTGNIAVLGAQLGDEAKARVAHWFSQHNRNRHYVIRFSGGANAGHTLYHNGKKIVRHLLPSADFSNPECHAFLGSGMVINPEELLQEVKDTDAMFPGASAPYRITIDPDAFVVLPKHLKEDKENVAKFGSTGRGITPCYRDKINRCGTKIRDLIRDNNEMIGALMNLGVRFSYVAREAEMFDRSDLIFEGAQSVMLDQNYGAYPYVSSGECTLGGIFNAGFSQHMPNTVYGVIKPYTTAVGKMPFPTEQLNEWGETIREKGGEFGATTGRPRRVGALDFPALRYSIAKGGITDLILSKLDILNGMKSIPVCRDYEHGDPMSGQDFFRAKPVMEEVKGWKTISEKDYSDEQFWDFVRLVEKETQLPNRGLGSVSHISWGTGEKEMACVENYGDSYWLIDAGGKQL